MITELDLEAAQLAVEDAERGVVAAENTSPAIVDVGAAYAYAQGRLRHATAAQARLVAQHAAERAAAEAFVAAEKEAAKRLTAMDKESAAAREKVQAAFRAAQDALVALVDAVDDRNATLGRHAEELADLGLVLPVGGEGEHKTGVTARCEVKLRGGWWKFLDASLVVNLVTERVKSARFPSRIGIVTVRRLAKASRLFERYDVDLEAVPLPAEGKPRLLPAIRTAGPVEGAPVYLSDRARAAEAKDRKVTWREVPGPDEHGKYAGVEH